MAVSKSKASHGGPFEKPRYTMNASFREKSVWIQLISLVVGLGAYFVAAGGMLHSGVHGLIEYMPLFAAAVAIIVGVNVIGHIVAAVTNRTEGPDERDRLIAWRAESRSSWILGVGVIAAMAGMTFSVGEVWIAHLLLLSLFMAEVTKEVNQLVYYRRGL